MRHHTRLPATRRAVRLFVTSSCVVAFASGLTACAPAAKPAAPSDSGQVTESFSVQDTGTASTATSTISSATVTGGAKKTTIAQATAANPTSKPDATPVAGTTWPAKMGEFAKTWKRTSWYPASTPKGYELKSLDSVELDPGAGLVCSVVFTNGKTAVNFTQGSPNNRTYPIVSTGKTAWGSGQADLMHQDPADTNSPLMIVYSEDGNFAEVSGDAPVEELKAVAASMKPVTY